MLVNESQYQKIIKSNFPDPAIHQPAIEGIELAIQRLQEFGIKYQCLVLAGGWKYGETTIRDGKMYTDIDIFICSTSIPQDWRRIKQIESQINKELDGTEIHFQGLIMQLINKTRTLWSYRLKSEGIVLDGDENVLTQITAETSNLPTTEAIRTLTENLIGRLWYFSTHNYEQKMEGYQLGRYYLSLGEAVLMKAGMLAPSRTERLKMLEQVSGIDEEVMKRIKLGYEIKLTPGTKYVPIPELGSIKDAEAAGISVLNWIISTSHPLEYWIMNSKPSLSTRLLFWWRCIRAGLKPKLSVINLNPFIMYQWAWNATQNPVDISKWFGIEGNKYNLVEIIRRWPTPATIELE